MKMGELIKHIRKHAFMSQVQFAKEIGCRQSSISKFELGETVPSLCLMQQIVKVAVSRKIKITMADIFLTDEINHHI